MGRRIEGQSIAISGASAGIGKHLAAQLAARGAKLALAARRVERLEDLNRALGGAHFVMRADVALRQDCEAFIAAALAHFGRIDTLVCNAGYGLYRRTHETGGDEIRRMFATNVFGTTDLIHAAVPAMMKQELRDGWRGQIMIVSSAAARRGVPFLGPYSATKAAQLMLAESLRVELKDQRITVTTVHPIMTKTEFGEVAESTSDVKLPRHRKPSQSVDYVVGRMIRAIERPKPEVWPHQRTRLALAVGMLFPRLADAVLTRYLRMVEEHNR